MEYKKILSIIRNKIDTLKNRYFESKINSACDSKSLWKVFRTMGFATSSLPNPFKFFKANEINKYFSEISYKHNPISDMVLNEILTVNLNPHLPIFSFSDIQCNCI